MTNDLKIVDRKGIIVFLIGGAGALLSYLSGLPPEPVIVIVTALAVMGQNFLKHL